jgi:uncharacterized membrane protein YhaH (DUF805 family)
MNILDSIMPSGTLTQGRFGSALIGLLIGFVLSHMLSAPVVADNIGLFPFVATQIVLVWWWFALMVKRLRDAERSLMAIAAVALLDVIAVVLMTVMLALLVVDLSAGAAAPYLPASLGLLGYPAVFLFNLVTGPPANMQDGTLAVLAAFVLAPLLLTLWYTLWAALQPSELHTTA